jgi:DNA-binding response OmpR family regulator
MIKILLVEDDTYLGEALREYLIKSGFNCDWLEDDREMFLYLNSSFYDIIILDLMLKFSKGEDLLKKVRTKYKTPVIILTAKGGIEDKEVCFNLGADDYITKPFNPKELVLRINSVLKRYEDTILHFGEIYVDLKKKVVSKNNRSLYLSKKEWDILEFLLINKGKIMSVDDILRYVWQGDDVGEESVRTYIKRLRNVLGKNMIRNVKGRGYFIP